MTRRRPRWLCAVLLLVSIPIFSVGTLGCARPHHSPATLRDAAALDAAAKDTLDDADLALARRELEAAEHGYLAVLEGWPDDPRVLAGLTRVALARGDLGGALAWDDRAQQQPGSVPGSLGIRERCALWQRVAAARVDVDPDSSAALVARIEEDSACDDWDTSTIRGEIHAREALLAHARGETGAAIAASMAAVMADPSRVDVELQAARWLLEADREREALAWLSKALARHPGDQALLLLMLEALGVQGVSPHT